MRVTLPHPRDPSTILGADRPIFGSWHLTVNGTPIDEGDDGEYDVTIADGSRSVVGIEQRGFDPFPIFVIDGERHPIGLPLGVVGVVAALVPLYGLIQGWGGIITGLLGTVVTLRVARRWRSPILRLASGFGFACTARWVGVVVYHALAGNLDWSHPRPVQGAIPVLATLPAVADIPYRGGARYALAHLPEIPAVAPIPAGSDPVPPFTVAELQSIRGLVLGGRFTEAESALVRLEQEARLNVRSESRWRAAYRMSFQAMPDTFALMLDRWVAASPVAATPLAARAWNRYWQAYYWRGETPRAMSAEMARAYRNALANAAEDATEALTLDPDLMPAYWVLQNIARTEGDQDASGALVVRALRRSPTSYETYTFAMNAIYPEWGGSTELMAKLGDAGAEDAGLNPDLGRLHGFAGWKEADEVVESGDPRGIALARRALHSGKDYRFYQTLGHLLYHADQLDEARAMLDSAIVLEPTSEVAYDTRYRMLDFMAHNAQEASGPLYAARDADLRMVYLLRPMMEP